MTEATQPDQAASGPSAETDDEQQPTERDTGAEATDRPGDIPFDQAAAEHENPALE